MMMMIEASKQTNKQHSNVSSLNIRISLSLSLYNCKNTHNLCLSFKSMVDGYILLHMYDTAIGYSQCFP